MSTNYSQNIFSPFFFFFHYGFESSFVYFYFNIEQFLSVFGITLLGRGFFVFSSLTRSKKETSASSCLPFVSIHPKVWTGKYQNRLTNDGVCSCVLYRKQKHNLAVFFRNGIE